MQSERSIEQSIHSPHLRHVAAVGTEGRGPTTDRRIALSVRIIEKEYQRPNLDTSELAKLFHLSKSRFRHLFLQQVGKSPSRFLKTVRLQNARFLLETSFLAVKEVMHKVGYTDASHFTRDYRATYHVPPSKHLRQFFTAAAG